MNTTKVAVLGSGNIGTDLMMKAIRLSERLEVVAMAGIDPSSDGLDRARRLGVATTPEGVAGLTTLTEFADVTVVLDATSAAAHGANNDVLQAHGKRVVDLTPAALGPYVVPPVNLADHVGERNINMVTCGGQATIPIVAALSSVTRVRYAEIVASIASRSAGPGTRANIDEFTVTTARAIERVGRADRGKAIIVLNPAEPPLVMRDTVLCIVDECDREAVVAAVMEMVRTVQAYVPGYRLKQDVQIAPLLADDPAQSLVPSNERQDTWHVAVFLEVEGAGHYLPPFAGNLDIMTSAALRVAEGMADHSLVEAR